MFWGKKARLSLRSYGGSPSASSEAAVNGTEGHRETAAKGSERKAVAHSVAAPGGASAMLLKWATPPGPKTVRYRAHLRSRPALGLVQAHVPLEEVAKRPFWVAATKTRGNQGHFVEASRCLPQPEVLRAILWRSVHAFCARSLSRSEPGATVREELLTVGQRCTVSRAEGHSPSHSCGFVLIRAAILV